VIVSRSLEISPIALQPPVEVYGEYAIAKGFDESNDGTELLFNETLAVEIEEAEALSVDTAAVTDAEMMETVG
jgi:hypothetical protein